MWIHLAFLVLEFLWFQLSLFSSTCCCLLRFALLFILLYLPELLVLNSLWKTVRMLWCHLNPDANITLFAAA
jgi:hypothetical protein